MRRRTRSSPEPMSSEAQGTTLISSFETDTKTKFTGRAGEIPGEWLSALLTLACALPIEEGPEAVANVLVETVGRILPDHAFGLSLNESFEPDKTDGGRFLR